MSEPVYALPAVDLEKWSHCRTLGPQKRDALIAEIRRLRTEVAALASSPSEPLVEVAKIVEDIRSGSICHSIRHGEVYAFDLSDEEAAALITARDAQVAARVREENKTLREALQSLIDAVASCEKYPSERRVELLYGTCAESRAALTATGGGE